MKKEMVLIRVAFTGRVLVHSERKCSDAQRHRHRVQYITGLYKGPVFFISMDRTSFVQRLAIGLQQNIVFE